MVKLVNIDMLEFKQLLYEEYIKLFPKGERKSYKLLNESYKKGILSVIKIIQDSVCVGFIMTNSIKASKYLQIDYLAILPKYQGKGLGTEALMALKESSTQYNGIFIEIERIGLGKNEQENILRERRKKFYERIGFYKLNFDLDLYNVIYTPYVLLTSDTIEDDEKILKSIFKIYNVILGEQRVKEHCSYIKDDVYGNV